MDELIIKRKFVVCCSNYCGPYALVDSLIMVPHSNATIDMIKVVSNPCPECKKHLPIVMPVQSKEHEERLFQIVNKWRPNSENELKKL